MTDKEKDLKDLPADEKEKDKNVKGGMRKQDPTDPGPLPDDQRVILNP